MTDPLKEEPTSVQQQAALLLRRLLTGLQPPPDGDLDRLIDLQRQSLVTSSSAASLVEAGERPRSPGAPAWRANDLKFMGPTAMPPDGPADRRTMPSDGYLGAQTSGLEASVSVTMTHVPTAIVHLLDPAQHPLVKVTLGLHRTWARIRLTCQVEGYSARWVETHEFTSATGQREFSLLPTFHAASIASLREVTAATIQVEVEDLGGPERETGAHVGTELHRSLRVWLLPPTTAYLSFREPSGSDRDMTRYLGAWVTPNDPAVLRLVRQAASRLGGGIVGYQDEARVEAQVKALFEELKALDMVYVHSILARAGNAQHVVQRVRRPAESLSDRCANCIDGTVLFASLLEASSLEAALVIIPGHAFVGWRTTEKGSTWRYLETTQIGHATFEQACAFATNLQARHRQAAGTPAYRSYPLSLLRREGILPME